MSDDEYADWEAAEQADEYAAWEAEQAKNEPGMKTVPPKDLDAQQRRIQAGMLPEPGGLSTAAESIAEAYGDLSTNIRKRAFGGLLDRAMAPVDYAADAASRATGINVPPVQPLPEPGARTLPEDYLPSPQALATVPTMAIEGATVGGPLARAGQTLARAPQTLARVFGASPAQTAVRQGFQTAADAAATGGLYGATDTALRGGSPGQVAESAAESAAANLLFSQAPRVAGAAKRGLDRLATSQAMKPLKETAKQTQAKAVTQFSKGKGQDAGDQEMRNFIEREDLIPILRNQKTAEAMFDARQQQVWDKELKPIYDHALAAEPSAAVPIAEIESRLKSLIGKSYQGTGHAEIVNKYIKLLKDRAAEAGFGDRFPLQNLLNNAREFQNKGWGGVVNFDSPTEAKEAARNVGRELRNAVNAEIEAIFRRNPENAYALATEGAQWRPMELATRPGQPQTLENYPNRWASRYENLQDYVEDVPRRLAEGNKRYSDYAKMSPLVTDAAKRFTQNKMSLKKMTTSSAAGLGALYLGHQIAGVPGAMAATAAVPAAMASYPYAVRAGQGLAGALSNPVGAGLPGSAGVSGRTLQDAFRLAGPQALRLARPDVLGDNGQ